MIKKCKKRIAILTIILLAIITLSGYTVSGAISVGKVKNAKVSTYTTNSITVKWSKVSNATGYRVYVYSSKTGKYKFYKQTTSKSMKITGLTNATAYKIKIRAYRVVKGKKYYGAYSSVISTGTKPAQVKKLKASSQTTSTIKLSWSKVTRASGYRVYVYNSTSKTYKYYGQTTTNSMTVKDLSSAKTYKIKVRAYRTYNGTKYFGAYSSVLSAATKPAQVKNLKASSQASTSITLSWSAVTRASGYRVYLYNSTSGSYEYYGQTTDTTLKVSSLSNATTYKMKVRAYYKLSGTKYYGTYSSVLTSATGPKKVTGLKSTKQTTSSITVSWSSVSKASGYAVYYCSYSSVTKKTTTSTSLTISDLDTAKFYKIYVKAYYTSNGTNYYGTASSTISQKTLSTDTVQAGIDVSKYQGTIDWAEVKAAGVEFAIIRVGWIGNSDNHTLDTKFKEYYTACKEQGLPVGVYVYNYCKTTSAAESGAKWVVEQLTGKEIDLPVYIDMEDSSLTSLGKTKLTKIATTFNEIIVANGYEAAVYANLNWFTKYLDKDTLAASYKTWIAHYSETASYNGSYDMFQYSSKGIIDGISGNVDLDIKYY